MTSMTSLYLDAALLGNLTRRALVLDLIINGRRVQVFRHVGGEGDVRQVDEAGHGVQDDRAVNAGVVEEVKVELEGEVAGGVHARLFLPLPASLRDGRRGQRVVHRDGEEVGLSVPEMGM